MNVPKAHDNRRVQAFVSSFIKVSELCEALPAADDILSGVLALKTAGDTASRSLSRGMLFHVLQMCPTITVEAIKRAVGSSRYAYGTCARYAAAARVASRALDNLVGKLSSDVPHRHLSKERELLDVPHQAALQALGLV